MPPSFQTALLKWYDTNRRDLPWRGQTDPYAVWVSEIMLQQTQVATVLPYYKRWMERFPDVKSLARAEPQDALAAWQGLGYYRRCRLLLQGAKFVAENGPPTNAIDWRKVPGVGRYTAGAIASISFGEATPVVDGNVLRVFARLEGCENSGAALEKSAWEWTEKVIDRERPGDWNQALMELGATICRPGTPECPICPLKAHCSAFRDGTQLSIPKRLDPPVVVEIHETAWICRHRELYGIRKIASGQWWSSMWEFPRVRRGDEHQLRAAAGAGKTTPLGSVKYQVTRHRIMMDVHEHLTQDRSPALTWVSEDDLNDLPLPAPQRRALKLAQAQGNLNK